MPQEASSTSLSLIIDSPDNSELLQLFWESIRGQQQPSMGQGITPGM